MELQKCSKLEKFSISYCDELESLAGLDASSTTLTVIYIYCCNRLADTTDLKKCTALTTLTVQSCSLKEIPDIYKHYSLQKLNYSDNHITILDKDRLPK